MERYSDVLDMAQAHVEQETAQRIDRIRRSAMLVGSGTPCCIDCGTPIPDARRRHLPGASRCVRCQRQIEGGR